MSRPEDRDPILPNAPPPYTQPQENAGATVPNEPPPKYEPPKGEYPATYQGGYPPQGGYAGQGGYQTTPPSVILVTTQFGPHSQQLQCPHCMAHVMTNTDYQAGGLTWLAAGLICLFGCWLGCCLIPFCINDLQDVHHTCPNCNRLVGVCKRLD
ncbi:lipopolysaccharide-induced tumor necrosis factor-alpha factor homolog isoform X2 [Haliotis rubra]|uniref:lipopolysaccharide-induced tumor necrosis factor-alpha factor homolog isoform X2 n=1 Tax=Haliotis rubra TaxID=36100 RepID=UPI001EE58983|nr:lipopolysaccharide-induced tumor necrosis factor-alpha factor homolog isoform X2 [Haliotis rubra]